MITDMEISEKLDIFYQAALEAAREQSAAVQEEYRNTYEDALAAYEKEKTAGFQTRERIQEEKIRKEVNRATSAQLMQLKKEYHEMEQERKAELFSIVEQKLFAYRQTKAYRENLSNKIRKAKALVGKEIKIYLDSSDDALQAKLQAETGCELMISDEAFGGGIRTVISEKNILLDESFGSRFSEEKEKFLWV